MTTTDEPSEHPQGPTVAAKRKVFNGEFAQRIADELHLPERVRGSGYSNRFAYFGDEKRLAVVAGAQEGDDVELALVYAVAKAGGRATTLVLPQSHCNATRQRIPWLRGSARPTVYLYNEQGEVVESAPRSRANTIQALEIPRKGALPDDELTKAMAPAHLGAGTDGVWKLVEWATGDRRLDHGHRRRERSWHFAGQRVLSVKNVNGGVAITFGIHYSGDKAGESIVLTHGEVLSNDRLEVIKAAVGDAVQERRSGAAPIHRADEHWLQAIIRREPGIVGVEQPALRELPAWRPRDSSKEWGRGFIDLLGLDGHGNIRIVETKLADNADDLLVLQGLDYFVWAKAYEGALKKRLGTDDRPSLELHYVLGATAKNGEIKVSPCTKPLADALDPQAIRWRSQAVRGWFHPPEEAHLTPTDPSQLFEMLTT